MLWLLQYVVYQIIQVNQTTPCFFNTTAGADMWRNCGITTDYLQTVLLPWEWITGGYFSFFLVSIFVGITYIKYHKIVYPILVGVIFLPISFFVFPEQFLSFAILFAFIGGGLLVAYIFLRQTKEYNG